jgi:hypothetical protein
MDEKMTCEEFQERLDGHIASDEERRAIERHAAACPDCALLLAMNRHLNAETLSELEERVPDSLVDTMWQRVVGEIAARRAERLSPQRRFWPFQRIFVPAMAAAIVLLVFTSGYLLGELRHLRRSERQLAMELSLKDQRLEEMQHGMKTIQAGRLPERVTLLGVRLGLPQQADFSASELISLLELLPRETTMLEAGKVESMLQQKRLPGMIRARFQPEGIDIDDGLQAGEIIILIEWLDIDPARRFQRDELVSFARTGALPGVL